MDPCSTVLTILNCASRITAIVTAFTSTRHDLESYTDSLLQRIQKLEELCTSLAPEHTGDIDTCFRDLNSDLALVQERCQKLMGKKPRFMRRIRYIWNRLDVQSFARETANLEGKINRAQMKFLINISIFQTKHTSTIYAALEALRSKADGIQRQDGIQEDGTLTDLQNGPNVQARKAHMYTAGDAQYMQVLDAIQKGNSPGKWVRRSIGMIVTVREPLPVSALAKFMNMSPQDVESTWRILPQFVVDPPAPHRSFVEFLTDKERCTDARLFIDVQNQDTFLARRCLQLMLMTLEANTAKPIDILPEELRYACHYWVWHMTKSKSVNDEIMLLLDAFVSQHLLSWIRTMCRLKSIQSAILMMNDTVNWAESKKCSDQTITLLRDGHENLLKGIWE